jgi:hypothetical protein
VESGASVHQVRLCERKQFLFLLQIQSNLPIKAVTWNPKCLLLAYALDDKELREGQPCFKVFGFK